MGQRCESGPETVERNLAPCCVQLCQAQLQMLEIVAKQNPCGCLDQNLSGGTPVSFTKAKDDPESRRALTRGIRVCGVVEVRQSRGCFLTPDRTSRWHLALGLYVLWPVTFLFEAALLGNC
jgi:hypothetical protein